jgi:hypothetical protein
MRYLLMLLISFNSFAYDWKKVPLSPQNQPTEGKVLKTWDKKPHKKYRRFWMIEENENAPAGVLDYRLGIADLTLFKAKRKFERMILYHDYKTVKNKYVAEGTMTLNVNLMEHSKKNIEDIRKGIATIEIDGMGKKKQVAIENSRLKYKVPDMGLFFDYDKFRSVIIEYNGKKIRLEVNFPKLSKLRKKEYKEGEKEFKKRNCTWIGFVEFKSELKPGVQSITYATGLTGKPALLIKKRKWKYGDKQNMFAKRMPAASVTLTNNKVKNVPVFKEDDKCFNLGFRGNYRNDKN